MCSAPGARARQRYVMLVGLVHQGAGAYARRDAVPVCCWNSHAQYSLHSHRMTAIPPVMEETTFVAPQVKATAASTATVSKTEIATGKKSGGESGTSQAQKVVEETTETASKGSPAARPPAHRQNQGQTVLKPVAPRNASLITAEHYAYVRRDLIYILILAIIMFSAIVILHFVPAIGG